MRTALLFALPEEYEAFRRSTGPWQRIRRRPFKTFLSTRPSQELILVETGMGQEPLLEALSWLLGWTRPDLLVVAGFAGSLSEALAVGDVCLGETYLCLADCARARCQPGLAREAWPALHAPGFSTGETASREADDKPPVVFHLEPCAGTATGLMRLCRDYRLHETRLITVTQPQLKPLLARKFADRASVIDMESYAAVRFCYEHRLPLLGIRAVSDGLWDEIDFDLAAISDARGRVSLARVLLSIVRCPGLLKSYYRSWRRSRTAAQRLARVLIGLTRLPTGELVSLIASLSYTKT